MPELCQWVININYLAARLRQIYSKPAARFICMVKTNCRNLAVGLRQSSSKLAARSPLALPQGLFLVREGPHAFSWLISVNSLTLFPLFTTKLSVLFSSYKVSALVA